MSDTTSTLIDAIQELHEEATRLPDGAKTIREIMAELNMPYDTARGYVNQLIEEGKAYTIRRGRNKHYYVLKDGIN